ncbi:MAG: N-acetyltransferase [Chloroflexi bacterium]|nr:N-acetyltransferase [Chloroflexota bacterium]
MSNPNGVGQPATLTQQAIVAEKATVADVPQIHRLVKLFADRGDMLHRSLTEIYENLRDFHVARDGERVVGCAALHLLWADLAEVRSVAVHPDYQGRGLARVLVEATAVEARSLGLTTIFCLTYRPEVFGRLGFVRTGIEQLPRKVWGECYRCPKFPICGEVPMVRVLYDNVTPSTGGVITLPVLTRGHRLERQ